MISFLPLLSWTLPVSVKENLDQKNYSNNSNFEGWLFCQNNIDILIIIILVYQLDIRTDFQRNFKHIIFQIIFFEITQKFIHVISVDTTRLSKATAEFFAWLKTWLMKWYWKKYICLLCLCVLCVFCVR